MQLNKTLEAFYMAILSYAGTTMKDNIIVNINPKLGDVMIDDKHLTLPYFENLRSPGDKLIFHPLNENYATPENAYFNLYKKKLVFELNMRLSTLIISLLKVGSEPLVQQRLKSEAALTLVSNLGEVDITTVEHFVNLVKASQAENKTSFLFDIYLRKNGSVGEQHHLAIGKINFLMYRELQKALDDKDKGYKVYGYKLRKKDIITLLAAFDTIFPNMNNPQDFMVGSDNKVFRYFSALLLSSYPVAYRINEVAELLEEAKDPSLSLEDAKSDLSWSNIIQELYPLTDVIREIPDQTCLKTESHQLVVDESKVKEQERRPSGGPVYSPPATAAPAQPVQQQQTMMPVQTAMTPVQQQAPSAEDIIRGSLNRPMMQPGMMVMQPGMVMTPQGPVMQGQMPQMMPQGTMMMTPQGPVMVQGGMMPGQPMQPVQPVQNPGGWTSFAPTPSPQMMQPGMVVMQPGMMMQGQPGMMPVQTGGIPLNPQMMNGGGHTFG